MCGLTKCRKPVVLSDEIYWWLCKRKVELQVHSLDDVLREELYRFKHETGQKRMFPSLEEINEGMVYAETEPTKK